MQQFDQVVPMSLVSALRKQRQADLCSEENVFVVFTGVGCVGRLRTWPAADSL